MTLKAFFKLVEIQTKVASVIPFALGTVYTLYRFDTFNIKAFFLMLISMVVFDMTATAINNYYDYRNAYETKGYGYLMHNAIVKYNLKESTVRITIFFLLAIAIFFGILLFLNTTILVLLLGVLCFVVGILYSFGPVPISRTPFGEIFSGLFMGFIIVFISVYIHIYDQGVISWLFETGILSVHVNILEALFIFLLSVPTVNGIANIMLANNICDREEDIANKRYTLPVFVGIQKSLKIFEMLYYIAYIDILILIVIRTLPLVAGLALLTIIPVRKNILLFYEKQSKAETFPLAVKNFILSSIVYVITIGIAVILS